MMPDRRRITRAWLVLALLVLPAVTFATGSAASDTAGWPTSRANFQRTGKSLLPGPRSQPAVEWHVARSATGGNADGVAQPAGGTPTVGADGSVYVHNVDGVSVFTPTGSSAGPMPLTGVTR